MENEVRDELAKPQYLIQRCDGHDFDRVTDHSQPTPQVLSDPNRVASREFGCD